MSQGPPPAYTPMPQPGAQIYTTPSYQQQPISSQPPGWVHPQPIYGTQPPPPGPIYGQPPQTQTIIVTDPNCRSYCHDCHHGRCRTHGGMTEGECCCLAIAAACCVACLASNN